MMRDRWVLPLVFFLLTCLGASDGAIKNQDTSAPRFKHSVRLNHYNYLGDTVRFKCIAIGIPTPKVHWFRNGLYLNYSYIHNMHRYHEDELEMSLEIQNIDLRDKGEWHCRVWNNEGSITRTFVLHIIDYCDIFLSSNLAVDDVPLECVCQWKMLKFTKDGVNFDSVTEDVCRPYKKDNTNVVLHRRTACSGQPCTPTQFLNTSDKKLLELNQTLRYKDIQSLNKIENAPLSAAPEREMSMSTLSPSARAVLRIANAPKILEFDAKLQKMPSILAGRPSVASVGGGAPVPAAHHDNQLDSIREEEELEGDYGADDAFQSPTQINNRDTVTSEPLLNAILTTFKFNGNHDTVTQTPGVLPTASAELTETTTRAGYWPGPKKLTNLAPYFRKANHGTEPVISPAGRTVKLSCQASGIPKPQVNWYKDRVGLSEKSIRSGAPYKFRGFDLEMQDVIESDSDKYYCEVFNKHGTIRKEFEVRIVDRIRSKPIVVPNVLLNQTVDVNSTVNFTCKVISDTLPYFTWVKLFQINGSYINASNPADLKFNLQDAYFLPKATVIRDQQVTVLRIENVTIEDQGLYSCIAGNSLGLTMANATLTVNEFRPMTIPTGDLSPPTNFQFIIFIAVIFLAIAILAAIATYIIYQRLQSKNRIQNLDVLKKVVIRRKEPKDGETWTDLASSYDITIEPIVKEKVTKKSVPGTSVKANEQQYVVQTEDTKWEIDRSRLDIGKQIGEGAFGEVCQATYEQPDGETIPVALKRLKNGAKDKELITLCGEMQIFKSIGQHKNVLRLIGCCTGQAPLFVVMELCPYGNLRTFLKSHRPRPVEEEGAEVGQNSDYMQPQGHESPKEEEEVTYRKLYLRDLLRFATEIARGMEFLASRKIIHRDLAARNVLVADQFVMKISDFGLSRNVNHKDYYRKQGNGNLPIKWMAPESLDDQRHIYTTFSDVWSYGITVWEIMSLGVKPYPHIRYEELYGKLREGYRMGPPYKCPREVYSVMRKCWEEEPEDRPSFKVIADYFDQILRTCSGSVHSDDVAEFFDPENDQGGDPSEERQEEDLIYDTAKSHQPEPHLFLAPEMEPFEEFMEHASDVVADNQGEDSPLLGRRNNQSPHSKRKHKLSSLQHFYMNTAACFNQEKPFNESVSSYPGWQVVNETGRDSDTNTNTSEINHHDYVNDGQEVPSSKPSSKGSRSSNMNVSTAMRHSHLSDSLEQELGAYIIYSSPPSKKSSSSNLSVCVNPMPPSRVPSQNGFIQRSYSTESQTSSGRGGSSAMSSAEGLGGIGDLCQIEYTTISTTCTPKKSTGEGPSTAAASSSKSASKR